MSARALHQIVVPDDVLAGFTFLVSTGAYEIAVKGIRSIMSKINVS